ncbi:MAG: hypothetical protein FGM24_08705 [Candidatus Kapabacteria bacterium]|nr:hypothetical protein [Candidatus Kapabacteria bacterium]
MASSSSTGRDGSTMATNPHISVREDRASVTCRRMDALTRLRLVLGPVRPFLVGKLTGAMRTRWSMRRLRRRAAARNGDTYTPVVTTRSVRRNVIPMPSPEWVERHGPALRGYVEGIVEGNLPVYGTNMFRQWQADPLSGYEWPKGTWFADCVLATADAERPRGVDIRVPHEVGRCHHWPALALAACLWPERASVYVQCLEQDLASFYTTNPPQYGPQWTIAMGVGIRAANLALTCDWLAKVGLLSAQLEHLSAAMLVDHAQHITATVEWSGGMRTSHYLGNMLGLLAVGTYLVGEPRAERWRAEAASALTREWDVQFLPDGMSFEGSTGYHRHIVDMMLLAAMLLRSQGPLPVAWTNRLQRSVQALCDVLVDGRVNPAIGDDDDGMAIKLLSYEPDVSYTLDMARLLGIAVDRSSWQHRAFKDFGLYLWRHGRCRTSIRCGPIGQWGKGGHAHNDQLSVTFGVDGHSVVIDPGVVCYGANPMRRNRDRSTAVHATLAPEGLEQNAWPDGPEGLFWMLGDRARAHVMLTTDQVMTAEHRGFGEPHRRTVLLLADGIDVEDTWSGMPSHPADIVLPLAPACSVSVHENHALISGDFGICRLDWQQAHARVEPFAISKGYACSVDSMVIRLRTTSPSVRWSIRVVP